MEDVEISRALNEVADELHAQVPAGLAELMRIEGLGPKRARQLHEGLGIRTAADLKTALRSGRVATLHGFGAKTIEKLERSIGEREAKPERMRLADADQVVAPLLAYLRNAPGVERVEAAGSYRRRSETVGDIDVLVVSDAPQSVMERLAAYPAVVRVQSSGNTRSTVALQSGLHVNVRVVSADCYGAALHYFTGSKAHNIAVRALGRKRGLRISEYGIFRVGRQRKGSPRRLGGAEEVDVFDAVGMHWVPPELREDRGEIEAALKHGLPELVELGDVRGDLQMHSVWSDGHDTIEEMAFAALGRGYDYICITDHSRAVRVAGGLGPDELQQQWRDITSVRRRLHGRMHLFRGMEVDILRDGSLDLPDEFLARLDLVVVAVHSHGNLSRSAMTDRVIRAISHPATDILAHPTGRLINRRKGFDIDMEVVLRAAADLSVAVELNAQPDRLDLDDIWARRAKELGVLVAINTDAHSASSLAFMRHGVDQARRGWLESRDVLNTRSLEDLTTWLHRLRPGRRPFREAG
jgi:DNA polymerase (family X)